MLEHNTPTQVHPTKVVVQLKPNRSVWWVRAANPVLLAVHAVKSFDHTEPSAVDAWRALGQWKWHVFLEKFFFFREHWLLGEQIVMSHAVTWRHEPWHWERFGADVRVVEAGWHMDDANGTSDHHFTSVVVADFDVFGSFPRDGIGTLRAKLYGNRPKADKISRFGVGEAEIFFWFSLPFWAILHFFFFALPRTAMARVDRSPLRTTS